MIQIEIILTIKILSNASLNLSVIKNIIRNITVNNAKVYFITWFAMGNTLLRNVNYWSFYHILPMLRFIYGITFVFMKSFTYGLPWYFIVWPIGKNALPYMLIVQISLLGPYIGIFFYVKIAFLRECFPSVFLVFKFI
jgi:hypothetical protein